MVILDIHNVAHAVHNAKEVTEHWDRHGWVENCQVRVACEPELMSHEVLELKGRRPGTRFATSLRRDGVPTCFLCVEVAYGQG